MRGRPCWRDFVWAGSIAGAFKCICAFGNGLDAAAMQYEFSTFQYYEVILLRSAANAAKETALDMVDLNRSRVSGMHLASAVLFCSLYLGFSVFG